MTSRIAAIWLLLAPFCLNNVDAQEAAQRNPRDLVIVAYADKMSVQPGDRIRFMVSSLADRYRAD